MSSPGNYELSQNVRNHGYRNGHLENPQNVEIQIGSSLNGTPFQEEHPLHKYFRVLLAHRKLVISISLVILSLSTLYSFLVTPLYTAETELSIGSHSPTLYGAGLEDTLARQTEKQDYLETQFKLLTRLTLADRVLSDSRSGEKIKAYLNESRGIKSFFSGLISSILPSQEEDTGGNKNAAYNHPIRLLKSYLGIIKIEPVKRTFLVKAKVTTANPSLSAEIANLHSQHFINLAREEKQKTALASLFFLREQAGELASKVSLVEQEIAQYSEDNTIVSLNDNENILNRKMSELNKLLTDATSKRIKSEATYNEAKSGSSISSSFSDSKGLEDLRLRLRSVEAEYAKLGEKFKPGYPRMVQMRAEIDSLKRNIEQQTKIILRAAESQYKADLATEEELKRELELQKSQTFDLSRKMVKFNTMKREFESLKDLHQSVLRQLKETQISAESETNNITLTDQAAVPSGPSSPRKMLNFLLALFIGPVFGFGLALVIDGLNRTLETPEEMKRMLQIPSLGVVPLFDSESVMQDPTSGRLRELPGQNSSVKKIGSGIQPELNDTNELSKLTPATSKPETNLVTLDAPFSIASEAFRAVRTSLLLSSADTPPRVILVTSSRKGEGKTSVSSNLAVTIAGSVSSAVLIDCDLRRSALHKNFGVPGDAPGLVDILTEHCALEEAIYPTRHEKLKIIPAGTKPPNPAELLGSNKMKDLVALLKEKFEFVLIDSPPVLPVTDAVILSRVVDGVVFVIRGHKTDHGVAKEARNRITQVGGKILGAILNGVDVAKGQHYYYYRDAYSEYYAEDTETPKRGNFKLW